MKKEIKDQVSDSDHIESDNHCGAYKQWRKKLQRHLAVHGAYGYKYCMDCGKPLVEGVCVKC